MDNKSKVHIGVIGSGIDHSKTTLSYAIKMLLDDNGKDTVEEYPYKPHIEVKDNTKRKIKNKTRGLYGINKKR